MKSITIEGEARKTTGKRETRELRKKEMVPCSIYGGKENINFVAPLKAFKDLVYTPEFYTATLKVDGKEINAVMQDIQFDPITDDLIHIDFLELHPDKKVTVDLPIRLEGTAAGTREGGKVNLRMKKLKVRLYPKDMMEHLSINIAGLELGKSIRVDEIKAADGIEFLNAPHIPVVSVLIPRAAKEETPAVTAAATPVAGAPAAGATPPAAEKGAKADDKKKEDKKK